MFLKKMISVLLLTFTVAGCATNSWHSVNESRLMSFGNNHISVSTELRPVNWNGQYQNSKFFIKTQGQAVKNYLLVQNQAKGFKTQFFGSSNSSNKSLNSYSEKINDISFRSEIYAYDFRFNRGGNLMELIDKSVNRSCGLIKVYTSKTSEVQFSYGKVVDCAILKMSLSNYKDYKISELVSELNETAKATFNIERM